MQCDDVILEIEGLPVTCNKEQLMNESSYFEVMFRSDFIEKNKKQIELKDVKINNFRSILQHLKQRDQKINCTDMNDLIEIYTTANMLQFTRVQNDCVAAINDLMTVDNVLDVWQTAERFYIEALVVKSRYLAVTEFEKVRETRSFLEMNSKWLFKFLANRNLVVEHEMDVFEAGMLWLANTNEKIANEAEILYTLITCLDFNKLSVFNIMEIQNHASLKNFRYVANILQYIIYVRNDETSGEVYSSDIIGKATVLLESKPRHIGGYPTFTLCNTFTKESDAAVRKLGLDPQKLGKDKILLFYYDGNNFILFPNPDKSSFVKAIGSALFSYKHLLYQWGGESVIGRETWCINVQVYDTLNEVSFINSNNKHHRRHAAVVTCGTVTYFIGGYGQYRARQNDSMLWYDCEKNCWSGLLMLPEHSSEQIMCCNYNKQLFIMFTTAGTRSGYVFLHDTQRWKAVFNCPDNITPTETGKTVMFSYNNNIFVKGEFLTEYELRNTNKLTQISRQKINYLESEGPLLDFCVCDDNVYSLYKREFEEEKILEIFSLTTRSATNLLVTVDRLFAFRHYNICAKEDFVNEYFKSYY